MLTTAISLVALGLAIRQELKTAPEGSKRAKLYKLLGGGGSGPIKPNAQ